MNIDKILDFLIDCLDSFLTYFFKAFHTFIAVNFILWLFSIPFVIFYIGIDNIGDGWFIKVTWFAGYCSIFVLVFLSIKYIKMIWEK